MTWVVTVHREAWSIGGGELARDPAAIGRSSRWPPPYSFTQAKLRDSVLAPTVTSREWLSHYLRIRKYGRLQADVLSLSAVPTLPAVAPAPIARTRPDAQGRRDANQGYDVAAIFRYSGRCSNIHRLRTRQAQLRIGSRSGPISCLEPVA